MKKQENDTKIDPLKAERALLVGIRTTDTDECELAEQLSELSLLVKNINIQVVDLFPVKIRKHNARYIMGTGKADELVNFCKRMDIDIIIFDDPISPSQQRNWEKLSKLTVIDRQEVIIDIFSSRAKTKEARLQVELAQAQYSYPRLTKQWTHLSRQYGGGIGQRGEGEKQLEVDRRMVKVRIKKLQNELHEVRKHRDVQRRKRERIPIPNAAIVGYTNAGKSSLLNCITGSDIAVEDKLFATLDPTTRRVTLPDNQELLLTDTVGFIRKLPHQLVDAFKSTLEEAVLADFLIHVVDASSSEALSNYETTMSVLDELGCKDKKVIQVFNKLDLVEGNWLINNIKKAFPNAIFTSVHTEEGIKELLAKMSEFMNEALHTVEMKIPHDKYDIVALLHRTANIISEKYKDDAIYINACVTKKIKKVIVDYICE